MKSMLSYPVTVRASLDTAISLRLHMRDHRAGKAQRPHKTDVERRLNHSGGIFSTRSSLSHPEQLTRTSILPNASSAAGTSFSASAGSIASPSAGMSLQGPPFKEALSLATRSNQETLRTTLFDKEHRQLVILDKANDGDLNSIPTRRPVFSQVTRVPRFLFWRGGDATSYSLRESAQSGLFSS